MTPRTKREYLRELVADKKCWSHPLAAEERALGFLGSHESKFLAERRTPIRRGGNAAQGRFGDRRSCA
jgi:hypothetical protein